MSTQFVQTGREINYRKTDDDREKTNGILERVNAQILFHGVLTILYTRLEA